MQRHQHLRRRQDFTAVYQQGRIWRNNLLTLWALDNGLPYNRYGFVMSRRLGKAVVRNRARRRLREAILAIPLQQGWDIIITPRATAAQASYWQLRCALADLLRRAHLLKEASGEH